MLQGFGIIVKRYGFQASLWGMQLNGEFGLNIGKIFKQMFLIFRDWEYRQQSWIF